MRFSFRKKTPRWVDSDALRWTPEQPFGAEPRGNPQPSNDDIGWQDDVFEPRAAWPQPQIAAAPSPAPQAQPAPLPDTAPRPDSEPRPTAPEAQVEAPPAPANRNRAPSLTPQRLVIGLLQGLGLYLLVQARDAGLWPGNDPWIFAALSLAGLFAPLLVLEGLGDIALPRLLVWSGIAAALLAGLGLYHHWRIQGQDQSHAGLALAATVALALAVAHTWLRACVKDATWRPAYTTLFDTGWTLAARLAIWAVMTAATWAFLGSGNSLFNWLRGHGLHPDIEPSLLTLPLVGLVSAAAFAMTGGSSWTRRLARKAMLACFTIALPMLTAVGLFLLVLNFLTAPLSAAIALGLAMLLLLGINASYRGDALRGVWRKICEPCAAVTMAALVTVAAIALAARIAASGWTDTRVYAVAATAMLALYASGYVAATLIALGGGRWMRRIETVNIALSLIMVAACLGLASPLADPLKLAVQAQQSRLARGADPALFDFAWLRAKGGRFGTAALADMAAAPAPEIARDAAITLSAPPGSDAPPPSQIGANITVRTPGARLPNAFLAQDWRAVSAQVPPCLTKPALACDAWFLDLDGDGTREILLAYGSDARWWASVLKLADGRWVPAAAFASPNCRGLLTALREGRFQDTAPAPGWRDLLVAGLRIRAKSAEPADLPCPR
jgi:hypothetical protein